MMECPKCHKENPESAEICDCGHAFAGRAAPATEIKSQSEVEALKKSVDLSLAYKPSGKLAVISIPVLIVGSVFACLAAQLLIAATGAAIGFCVGMSLTPTFQSVFYFRGCAWVLAVCAGVLGFGFAGYMIAKIMGYASKMAKNRSLGALVVFILCVALASAVVRLYGGYYLSQQFELGIHMDSPFDRPDADWIVFILGFFILIATGLGFAGSALAAFPFCESCGSYKKKRVRFLTTRNAIDAVNALKRFRADTEGGVQLGEFELRSSVSYPSIRVAAHECETCHSGNIQLTYNYLEPNAKGKMEKNKLEVFADSYASEEYGKVKAALGQ